MKRMLLGNEALALGAYMAGATVGTGYPGTPATEILEYYARYPGVYAEWSPNEKVALEVGIGAALAGARTITVMKHVGLNVAADPFFAVAYTGVEAGLVIVSADDPGMHSSQGEQDNRNYARFAKVPMLEPSDSQECADMMRIGLEMSEQFDTPVLVRTTGRVSHAQSLVEVAAEQIQQPDQAAAGTFRRNAAKYVLLPVNARGRRQAMAERLQRLQEYAETTPLNFVVPGDRRLGIVTSSIAYEYAREVFPEATFLKLGMAFPFPTRVVAEFARQVELLLVVEELDPYLEEQIRALPDMPSRKVLGKAVLPAIGEFSPELVARCAMEFGEPLSGFVSPAVQRNAPEEPATQLAIPNRPPVLCPGCGHRATFYTLRQLSFPSPPDQAGDATAAHQPFHRAHLGKRRQRGVVVTGDIGCYTLGALQPLVAMDTCGCMGASIGYALGMEKAGIKNKVVAVIGDSTFFHSGITGLVDVIVSGAATTVVILDNGTTAMTGGNANPGSGTTIDGQPARKVELETLCRGLGIQDVQVINGLDTESIERELYRALQSPEPSVLIVRQPCALKTAPRSPMVSWVDRDKCVSCWACLVAACPSLIRKDGKVAVIAETCTDCQVCNRICPHDAILRVERTPGDVEGKGAAGT